MDETTKDAIEYGAVQSVAGLLELFPGGSLLSRALLVPVELAERRRTERILNTLADQIQKLQDAERLESIDELVASDAFMANLHEVVRSMKTTSDDEKRILLGNALLNAQMDGKPRELNEFFIRLAGRYSVLHVRMLRVIEPLPPFVSAEESFPLIDGKRSGIMRNLQKLVEEAFPESSLLVAPTFQELASDGLIIATQPNTRSIADLGRDANRADAISDLGRAFVAFLRDPL